MLNWEHRGDRWERKIARMQDRMEHMRGRMERFRSRSEWFAPSSGNSAFDDYRSETLKRLEDEQREFKDFLARLRFAKDRNEFDQFMAERRERPLEPNSPAEPPAEPAQLTFSRARPARRRAAAPLEAAAFSAWAVARRAFVISSADRASARRLRWTRNCEE